MTKFWHALYDADSLVYALAWTTDLENHTEPAMIGRVGREVAKTLDALPPDHEAFVRLYLTAGAKNFRHKIAKRAPYKGQRPQEKPFHYEAYRRVMERYYRAQIETEQEADDIIAIEATRLGDAALIVSQDKDFLTVPGWHLRPKEGLIQVTPDQAFRAFYTQALTGDRVDNILGIHRVGEKKAAKIIGDLTDPADLFEACLEAYVDAGLTREDLVETCTLLHLRRTPGEIWKPPKRLK